jgi:proteasome lid subunit RPN8/RPN11
MIFFKKRKKEEYVKKQWKIKRDCLELILESAKEIYPKEFGGLLRVDAESNDTIGEIILLPGTISGDSHAIFQLHMLPVDFTIVGTVHSHPSPSFHPSDEDKLLFRKYGKVHIVVAKPFDTFSWNAYDYNGNELDMEIV